MAPQICPQCGSSRPSATGFCKNCGTRLVASSSVPQPKSQLLGIPSKHGTLLLLGGIIVALVIFGALAWARSRSQPLGTGAPSAVVTASQEPTMTRQTLKPTVDPTAQLPSATPQMKTPVTTPTPQPSASNIEPPQAFAGALPLTLQVRGANLNQVREVALVRSDGAVATVAIESSAVDQLSLIVQEWPQPITREMTFRLLLNEQPQATHPLTIRDYLETRAVRGVLAEYTSARINLNGPYTRMRVEANVNSEPIGKLLNGDQVDLLRTDIANWYYIRILSGRDASQNGVVGWIERWLLDNENVPIAVSGGPRVSFRARVDVNFENGGNSARFTSCVAGRVYGLNNRTYSGAQVNVNNGPKNSFTTTTDRGGVYRVCGLGASHWSVVLKRVPGLKLTHEAMGTVYVNGSMQEAIVHFFQR